MSEEEPPQKAKMGRPTIHEAAMPKMRAYVPQNVIDAVRAVAEARGETFSAAVREALKEWLARNR